MPLLRPVLGGIRLDTPPSTRREALMGLHFPPPALSSRLLLGFSRRFFEINVLVRAGLARHFQLYSAAWGQTRPYATGKFFFKHPLREGRENNFPGCGCGWVDG